MKKIISYVLIVLITFTVFPVNVFAADVTMGDGGSVFISNATVELFAGTGTELDPYLIQSAEDLAALATLINEGDSPCADAYFLQTADIDLSAYSNWTPIGNQSSDTYMFNGTYDGGNYTISNLSIYANKNVTSDLLDNYGLFGYASGEIKNVHMEGGNIDVVSADNVYVGSVVGYLTNGIVDNCSSSTNVSTQADLYDTATGGIVGYSDQNSTIRNSTNNGSVIGVNSIGGIIGSASNIVISNCTNSGSISADLFYYGIMTGGIVGDTAENTTVSNCSNSGDITVDNTEGSPRFGGIVGFSSSSGKLDISQCFNTGDILIEAPKDRAYAGGIVAFYSTGNITECYNTGNIDIKNREDFAYIGGIVGFCSYGLNGNDVTIMDCFNMGNMSSPDYHMYYPFVGGILGLGYSEDCAYINCYNVGEIDSSSSSYGGIAGHISGDNDGVFSNCYYADTCYNGIGDGVGTVTIENLSDLKKQATFIGFDFTDTWEIVEGERYPVLQDVPFVYATGVSIDDDLGLSVGSSQVLVPTVTPSNASNKNVSWESSDHYAVWVNSDGRVTLKKEGGATITVTTADGEFTDTCELFEKTGVTDITINKSTLTLTHHETEMLTATVLPDDATYPEVTWSSSDTSIAVVDQSGLVTATGPGEATITATADGVSDTCVITVEAIPVSSVMLSSEFETMYVNDTVTLTAEVFPDDATNQQVTWSSSNTDTAIVDQSGLVTAVGPGEATITATADGVSDTCVFSIEAIPVSSVTLSSESETMHIDDTITLTAEVFPDDATYPQVTWSSSNTEVATVDQNGLVTAVGLGEATITATADGVSDTCVFTVEAIPVSNVTLSSKSETIHIADSVTLIAEVMPSDASNKNVTWSSSNSLVATVSNGVVTAKRAGTATITVRTVEGGHTDTCIVTVTQPATGVSLDKSSASLSASQTVTLKATVTPSNASNKSVTWKSSHTSVATVSNGVVTAKGTGTATITVTTQDGRYTDTCVITVSQPVSGVQLNKSNVDLLIGETEALTARVTPSNAANKNVTWFSNNTNVATVWNGFVNAKSAGKATITVTTEDGGYVDTCIVTVSTPTFVRYQTHVQNAGWQSWQYDGNSAGTSGQSLRLEGMYIVIEGADNAIEYRTHVQNIGWQNWVNEGEMTGTSGQSLRLEAIEIRLKGEMANQYDIYYCVHAQNFGWMDWAKNGQSAGTAGFSYRLEAIKIVLVKKGGAAPGPTMTPFKDANDPNAPNPTKPAEPTDPVNPDPPVVPPSIDESVRYQTHVQNDGWQGWRYDGESAGTSGRSLRLEGMYIEVVGQDNAIEYRTHVQDIGWQDWVSDGEMTGTSGRSLRLEAIDIRLTGEMAALYDVYYRVHAQNFGWMDWAKNGQSAGTAGFSYRLEAIQIVLVDKGGAAPGATSRPFVSA